MPFAGYPDFNSCITKNSDKSNPQAFCSWLHHEVTGKWPAEMTFGLPDTVKEAFWQAFESSREKGKDESESMKKAVELVSTLGWLKQRHGWARRADHRINTTNIYGVPIFAVGEHNGDKYTIDDLGVMVDSFHELKGRLDPPVKIGHTSDSFNQALAEKMGIQPEFIEGEEGNGVMAFGWIGDLRVSGNIMYADLVDVPIPIKELIDSKSFLKVSAEIMFDYVDNGKVYAKVLSGLALLGGEIPAVKESGLEAAAIYTQGNKFDKSFEMALDVESVTYEQIVPTLDSISQAIENTMKGKPGVGIMRAMWKEVRNKVKIAMEGRKNSDTNTVKEVVNNNKEGDMNIEILKKLGLSETASDVEILAAVTKLAEGMPGEPGMPNAPESPLAVICAKLGLPADANLEAILAKIDEMMGVMQANDQGAQQFSSRMAKLEQDNQKLAKQVRIAHFKEVALTMPAVSGKPEEFAEEMYNLEQTSGEKSVEKVLASYKKSNDMLIKAGVFKSLGTPEEGNPNGEQHEFEKKVKAYSDEHQCSEPEAMAAVRKAQPKLFKDFMSKRRVVKTEK